MTALDVLLIIVGIGLATWGATQRTVKMLLAWLGLYLSAWLAGLIALLIAAFYDLAIRISAALGATGTSVVNLQAIMFITFVVAFFIAYEQILCFSMEEPRALLGPLDFVLGGILGLGLAIVILALLANFWGTITTTPWNNLALWQSARAAFTQSALWPHLRPVMDIYRKVLLIFEFTGYPPGLRLAN